VTGDPGHRPDERPDDTVLQQLVSRADLDGLVRLVDERCTNRDWEGLVRLRDDAREAVRTGRQLWPAATLAEYRLALLAPAPFVAGVLDDEHAGRFAIGPLTEVAAQQHTWAELAPHLIPGPRAALVAHERALRSEVIDPATVAELPNVIDLPYAIQPWEPSYCTAEYLDHQVRTPSPTPVSPPSPHSSSLTRHQQDRGHLLDRDEMHEVVEAVRELVRPWTVESNGRVDVVGVEGTPQEALAALGVGQARLTPLPADRALAWLGWAGASGGAHGRRRGAAMGRFATWWLVAALGGVVDQWPLAPAEIGSIATELRWWWWDAGEPETGWRLQLAVEDDVDGLSWAISAHDAD
jgi:hypothetical protein